MVDRTFAYRLALVALLLPGVACTPDLDEREIQCDEASVAVKAHAWADHVVLTPSEGHEWPDLLEEPFRSYGLPPVDMGSLQKRHGEFLERETATDTFAEYALPAGQLRLSLDRDRSGSAVHETWRLRFNPRQNPTPDSVIDEKALTCATQLRTSDYELVVLDRVSGRPKVSVLIREGAVQQLIWNNLQPSSTSSPSRE